MQWGGSTPNENDFSEDLSPLAVPERSLSANQVPSGIRYDKYYHWLYTSRRKCHAMQIARMQKEIAIDVY